MKPTLTLAALAATVLVAAPIATPSAYALSCLPTEDYLKSVVGDETIVIFTATREDRIEKSDYTAEVVTVKEGLQGYIEESIFVYHEKHPDWGYLCNAGPSNKETESIYIASRDYAGKYNVHQRVDVDSDLASTLMDELEGAEVTGGVSELSATDRMNQIITTITDLFKQIGILLNEFTYWKNHSVTAAPSLTSESWTWVETTYKDGRTVTPKKAEAFEMTFKNDSTWGASTDCNGVGGSYTQKSNALTFNNDMISTQMYCEGSQEDLFKQLLLDTKSYSFTKSGDLELTLKNNAGTVLFR